jgi:hypothetical protein
MDFTPIFNIARTHNSYSAARVVLNYFLLQAVGMGLRDLPDTYEFTEITEDIAKILDDGNDEIITYYEAECRLREVCAQITMEYVQAVCM